MLGGTEGGRGGEREGGHACGSLGKIRGLCCFSRAWELCFVVKRQMWWEADMLVVYECLFGALWFWVCERVIGMIGR